MKVINHPLYLLSLHSHSQPNNRSHAINTRFYIWCYALTGSQILWKYSMIRDVKRWLINFHEVGPINLYGVIENICCCCCLILATTEPYFKCVCGLIGSPSLRRSGHYWNNGFNRVHLRISIKLNILHDDDDDAIDEWNESTNRYIQLLFIICSSNFEWLSSCW